MLTASTYQQVPRFNSREKLDLLERRLFELAEEQGIALQAWALFPNHYHLLAHLESQGALLPFIRRLHSSTGKFANEMDGTPRRRVWFQYWDSQITFEKSYFARLHYVHCNAEHHGLVPVATRYPWCSAGWFEREASPSLRKTILSMPYDRVKVFDPFTVRHSDFESH
jgi:putative transposase